MFYTLVSASIGTLHTVAANRAEALVQFSNELGFEVVDQPTGANGRIHARRVGGWTALGSRNHSNMEKT